METTMERIRAQREAHNGETKIHLDEGYIKVVGWCKKTRAETCQLQFSKVVEGEEVQEMQCSWIAKNSCVFTCLRNRCHKLHSYTLLVRLVSISSRAAESCVKEEHTEEVKKKKKVSVLVRMKQSCWKETKEKLKKWGREWERWQVAQGEKEKLIHLFVHSFMSSKGGKRERSSSKSSLRKWNS